MSVPEDEVMGEVVELPEEDVPVEETDDGGAIIRVAEEEEAEEIGEFYDNIVEKFPDHELESLSSRLLEEIERDKKSRTQRDDQYTESIKRTGLGKEAPGGANFEGASKVVHPMLTEACVDFAARAVKELMPPNGPVKTYIPGKQISSDRLEKAERKKEYMNWQFTAQMPEFWSELEQLLTQLPLGGSMYLRLTPDYSKRKRRPVPLFVPLDYVSIPFAASNYYTAERQTYHESVTRFEFEARVREGMYREIGEPVSGQIPDPTKAQAASQKVEGKEDDSYNQDGIRIVHEVSCYEELEDEYGLAPYLISIDEPSRKIVSIIRNWEQDDEDFERMQWMVEFQFIPWRGAYAVGLGQMIGSLSGAATGALRALLDSAHINNIPTMARLKGAGFSGQSQQVNATEIIDIEGGVAGEADIRKLLMPLPFNQPSPVLFELLGFLVNAGKGIIHTAFEKLAEGRTDLPVGTTLALIEEGMRVMSAIHLRLFRSMSYLIRVLHRINRMYLTEEELQNDVGEVLAHRSDFEDPLDVVPVADPEIFSDVQRIAQLQIVADRAAQMPQVYNVRAVEQRLLERTKIPNPEELLIPEPKPQEMNQVNENAAMVLGQPVTAFPEQDHLGHLQVLLDFMTSPVLGQLPVIAPSFLPAALEHIKEHLAYWYVSEFYQYIQKEMKLDEEGVAVVMGEHDSETRMELDRFLAVASTDVVGEAGKLFSSLPPIIQNAQQILQQFQPGGMPIDPNKMADIEAKKEIAQFREQGAAQREQTKSEARLQEKVVDIQARQQTEERKLQSEAEDREAETEMHEEGLRSREEIEFAKLSASEREELLRVAAEEERAAAEKAARLRELLAREQAADRRAHADRQSKERQNTQDNLTALQIAAAEIESGEKVGVSTGTGVSKNPNPSGGSKR